jgi:hypothetical protein
MKALVSIDYATQGKRIDDSRHTESWLTYIALIQNTVDTLPEHDSIQAFGLGCWICSASSLVPLLDVVQSKRGSWVFQPRLVFLTIDDEDAQPAFPKSA